MLLPHISMSIAGYIASFFIGLTLGLLGGGGSILTVPVLVYLFSIEPVLATSYSLFIVGATSLTGVITKVRQRQVDWWAAFIFGLPSLLLVFITRKFILPEIPHTLFKIGELEVTRPKFLLLLFAALMILAATRMVSEKDPHAREEDETASPPNRPMLILLGAVVGLLAGLVGAGGGFLIIPALVPLALKGVQFRPLSAEQLLRRNLLVFGAGGAVAPFVGIKLIDLAIGALRLI